MSKFSKKHPKVTTAFNGAGQYLKKHGPAQAIGAGIGFGAAAAFGAVVAAPAVLTFVGTLAVADGAIGAYDALKAAKKNKPKQ